MGIKTLHQKTYMAPTDHWQDDPEFSFSEWQYEVAQNDTRLGYWQWVEHNRGDADRENV